jgi:hypothetical protein
MKTINIVAVAIISFFLFGCGLGKLPTDKQAYEGVWSSKEVILKITADAKVEYKKSIPGLETSINAPINKFEGVHFVVGALGMNTTFVVSNPPHKDGDIWKMTVDGVELSKEENF